MSVTQNGEPDAAIVRDRLREMLAALDAQAKLPDGRIDASRLIEARRLASLLEMHAKVARPSAPRRWFPAVAFGVTLVVVTLLLTVRVPSTQIQIRGGASAIGVVVESAVTATEPVIVRSLAISDAYAIDGPFSIAWIRRDSSQVHLHADTTARLPGRITLDALMVAPLETLSLRSRPGNGVAISLRGSESDSITLVAALHGALRLESPGSPAVAHTFTAPDQITLSSHRRLDGEISLAPKQQVTLTPLLPIRRLELTTVRGELGRGGGIDTSSTVRSGSIFLLSLGNKERRLRAGDLVRMDSISGTVRMLEATGDSIRFDVEATVRGLQLGNGTVHENLMPTWLEWLRARQSIALLWGTSIYLLGLVMSLRRWWWRGSD